MPFAPVGQRNHSFLQSPRDSLRLRVWSRGSAVAGTGVVCTSPPGGLGTRGPLGQHWAASPMTSSLFVDEATHVALMHHLDTSILHCLVTGPSQSYSTIYPTSLPPLSPSLRAGPEVWSEEELLPAVLCTCVCACLCVCVFNSTGDTLHSV